MRHDGFPNIRRDYHPTDVERLAGSFRIRHTLAEMGAARLRHLLQTEPFVPTLGALTGNQAVQQVKAGLQAIYLSGWQVAADANTAAQMYPDQSLYPVDSAPNVVRRINNALRRADQIARSSTANVPPRASSLSAPGSASSMRLRAASPLRLTPISYGGRRASPTSGKPSALPMLSIASFPERCWPTTARRASTGARSWRRKRWRASSAISPKWGTVFSSSLWPDFIASIWPCSSWRPTTAS